MSRYFRGLIIFVLISGMIFCYTYFYSTLFNDEIWNYGFAYNIATGLIPYRDFNMIITPFYSFFCSIFILIFGHHLWSMHILNSVMITFWLLLVYRKIEKKVFLLVPVILLYCYPGYNLFSLFLAFVIVSICDKDFKNKDLVMGVLCSILFLTKQTVGMFLFIPMIYYSKHKLKSIIGYVLPILLFIVYLIFYDAFYSFIDYCFLGMFDFSSANKVYFFLPLELFICFVILFQLIKSSFLNQKLFYILMFQIVTIPICDDYHFMIGFILVYYYILENIRIKSYRLKYYCIMLFFACFYWNYVMYHYEEIHLYSDSSSYLYGRYVPEYVEQGVTEISNYLENLTGYSHVYLFTQNSYMIKLNTSYRMNHFDLINDGNMGYSGSWRYIRELEDRCSDDSCLFILYKYEIDEENPSGNQTNVDILEYVYDNYPSIEGTVWFDFYTNDFFK